MNSNHGSSTAKVNLKPAIILGVATFLYWISLHAYIPLIPGYARSLGAGATIIGIIAGAYGFVQIFLRIPTGVWADRLGRYKPFVLVGCVLASVSGLLLIAVDSPLGLVIVRLLAGLAATCWLAFMVLFRTYFPQSTAKAVAIIATIMNLGILVGQSAGPYVASSFGLIPVFFLSFFSGLVATAIIIFVPDRKLSAHGPKQLAPPVSELLRVGGNSNILLASFLAVAANYLHWGGSVVFVNDWAQQHLAATTNQLGLLALCNGVPALLTTLLGGTWLSPRWGFRFTVILGFLVSALTIAIIPLLPNLQSLYWTQAVGGLARGLLVPQLMAFALASVPNDRGAVALGFFQSAYAIGMTLGPALTGIISDLAGLAGGFWVMGFIAMIGAAISTWRLPAQTSSKPSNKTSIG